MFILYLLPLFILVFIVSLTNGLQDYKSHETIMSRGEHSYAKFISIVWKQLAKDLHVIMSVVITAGDYYQTIILVHLPK